jgi:tetratricopeptide (TPR) repeat protein
LKGRSKTVLVLVLTVTAACGGARTGTPAEHPSVVTRSAPANPAATAKMAQGIQSAKEGKLELATVLLRDAVTSDGNLWQARYDLGVILANRGDLAGAEDELARASAASPDNQDVAMALAEVRGRRGEYGTAAKGIGEFVAAHPSATAARTLYVGALRESGQIDESIAQATEVLVRKPGDPTALAELSLAHLAKGEKDAAALLAKQAVDANPNAAVAHRATGLLDLANGDDAAAFAEFRKAAQADPRDTTSRSNMGVVLLRAGACVLAEAQYREILRILPDDQEAQVGLAAALRGQGDAQHPQKYDEARAVLERVVDLDPHDTSALFNLGVLYADFLKRPAQSAPLFKRFLEEAASDQPLRSDAERYLSAANAATIPNGHPRLPSTQPGATEQK